MRGVLNARIAPRHCLQVEFSRQDDEFHELRESFAAPTEQPADRSLRIRPRLASHAATLGHRVFSLLDVDRILRALECALAHDAERREIEWIFWL